MTEQHEWKLEFYALGKAFHLIQGRVIRGVLLTKKNDGERIVAALNEYETLEQSNTTLLEALKKIVDYKISPWIVKDTAERAIRKAKETDND